MGIAALLASVAFFLKNRYLPLANMRHHDRHLEKKRIFLDALELVNRYIHRVYGPPAAVAAGQPMILFYQNNPSTYSLSNVRKTVNALMLFSSDSRIPMAFHSIFFPRGRNLGQVLASRETLRSLMRAELEYHGNVSIPDDQLFYLYLQDCDL